MLDGIMKQFQISFEDCGRDYDSHVLLFKHLSELKSHEIPRPSYIPPKRKR